MLVLLFLASLCVATNWAVLFSTEDIVASGCTASRSCRLYDYLITSGMREENIVFLTPSLEWDNAIECGSKRRELSNSMVDFPSDLPYGDVCWSHLDYVGEYVDLLFLLDIIRGDKMEVIKKSGHPNPKVVQADEDSTIFVYYEESRMVELSRGISKVGSFRLSRSNLFFKSMIWLTDTSQSISTIFEKSLLNDGCLIVNFHQLPDRYAYIAYSPHSESDYMMVFTGMWDHSWVDALIMMSGFHLQNVVMAATAGLIQMNSTETIDFWGDESLLELSVNSIFNPLGILSSTTDN